MVLAVADCAGAAAAPGFKAAEVPGGIEEVLVLEERVEGFERCLVAAGGENLAGGLEVLPYFVIVWDGL